jgi:hypothetical protein
MGTVGEHSLERRIIEYLQDHYPVSARQLAFALRLPEKRVLMELRRMEARGWVGLDILPDVIYVRCLVRLPGAAAAADADGTAGREGKKGRPRGKEKERGGGADPAYL